MLKQETLVLLEREAKAKDAMPEMAYASGGDNT